MRDLAARLIAYETMGAKSSDPGHPGAFHVCERLRPHLAALMGRGGFLAVLARTLAVARGEVPWLAAVEVATDGSLKGWEKLEMEVKPNLRAEGNVILVAHLLGLLVAFIGDNLTLRLVRDVWPNVSLEDLKFT